MFNKISENLTNKKIIPWRFRHLGGPLNTIFYVHFRRKKLKNLLAKLENNQNSITVLYGVKNRAGYKLRNSLDSIRNQNYPQELINILVVDYGSDDEHLSEIKVLCDKYDAQLVQTNISSNWNKAHCMNIGIKQISTKFLLSSDVDIIFAKNYLSTIVDKLTNSPLSVLYSQTLDLGEDSVDELEKLYDIDTRVDPDALLQKAINRSIGDKNTGINATYTLYYHMIRGYDEFYSLWGGEDNDLYKRFEFFGLESKTLKNDSFYLHQWHKKHDGVKQNSELEEIIKKNETYFNNNNSILRNTEFWGVLD